MLGVHVFGYACDVEGIKEIANKHGLRVIYDGAHAFASRYKGRSLLGYGDVSTCSFHATKLFHTIEGGACITENAETAARLDLLRRFGNIGDEYPLPGINGKQTEFNAAMGLANFDHLAEILAARKHISELYDSLLSGNIRRPKKQEGLEYNYAYYPAVLRTRKNCWRHLSGWAIGISFRGGIFIRALTDYRIWRRRTAVRYRKTSAGVLRAYRFIRG